MVTHQFKTRKPMKLIRLEKQKEIHVMETRTSLSTSQINNIAKEQNLDRFEIQKYKHLQCRPEGNVFKGFKYVLSW